MKNGEDSKSYARKSKEGRMNKLEFEGKNLQDSGKFKRVAQQIGVQLKTIKTLII
jgi:hypothetical protein